MIKNKKKWKKKKCDISRFNFVNKKIILLIIFVIITSLISMNVFAIGVSPGRTTIDFTSGLSREIPIKIVNNEKKDMRVVIFTKGDLANYVKLDVEDLVFSKEDTEKSFNYKINLPQTLEPGLRETEITIREVPMEDKLGESTISALVAVVSQLNINVPYPGKYVKMDFHVVEAKQNEKVNFFIPVKSLGSEKIENIRPTIIIYDPKENEVGRVVGETKSLESKENYEFKIEWLANVPSGIYKAAAVLEYDGNRTFMEKQFLVGEFFLKPLDISVNNFKLGQVAKFNILIENVANDKINDATAKIELNHESGKRVADVSSVPTEVEPFTKKEVVVYWDTADVDIGVYSGVLRLKYSNKLSEKQIRTIIEEDAIRTEIIGVTGFAINTKQSKSGGFNFMYIIVGLLVIINIVWLVYYKKKQSLNNNT